MLNSVICRFLILFATLVKYVRSLSNILGLCIVFLGFVESVGTLYTLLGLRIVSWCVPNPIYAPAPSPPCRWSSAASAMPKISNSNHPGFVRSAAFFTRFANLGWIRIGDAVQNTLTAKSILFQVFSCFLRKCARNVCVECVCLY